MPGQRPDSSAERPTASFAERLEALYTSAPRPGKRRLTDKEVAEAVSQVAGKRYSPQYLWMLRRGQKDNPGKELVAALAEVFKVNRAYFYDDGAAEAGDAQPAEAEAAVPSADVDVDPAVLKIAHRADGLSEHWLLALDQLITHARQAEGLEDADTKG